MERDFRDVRNILVIKLRHIGDVLLTVPAIRALKETFPGSSVTALVNSGTEDMLTGNPVVDEVVPFDRSVKKLSLLQRSRREVEFVRALRKKRFDMSVDLTGGDRPALLGFFSGARYRLGFKPSAGFAGKKFLYTHMAERPEGLAHMVILNLCVVRAFGIDTRDLAVDIYSPTEDEAYIDRVLGQEGFGETTPFVHIHPTSRWFFKCWTDEGMADIIDRLESYGLRVVLTSGPDAREIEKVRSIISLARSRPVDLSGRLGLKSLAALSRRAAFFFGVDTAPMHIAAAAGTRVVGLFGPSGGYDWGPWDNIAARELDEDTLTPYPERNGTQAFGRNRVIQLPWDCVPCGRDGCEGSKKSECLEKLGPDEVWEVLKAVADEAAAGFRP